MRFGNVIGGIAAFLAGSGAVISVAAFAPVRFDLLSFDFFQRASLQSEMAPEATDAAVMALREGNIPTLRAVLSNDFNRTTPTGIPLLFVAAQVAPLPMVDFLLENGANPNARAPGGMTPLMGAVSANRLEIVNRLLVAGADPANRNDDGLAAGDLARAHGLAEIASRLRPTIASRVPKEATPSLDDAIGMADSNAVVAALARGEAANQLLQDGWTPLMRAVSVDCVGCLQALIASGAQAAAKGKDGLSALTLAALMAEPPTVALLVEAAAMSPESAPIQDAYRVALRAGRFDIARTLRSTKPTDDIKSLESTVLEAAIRQHDTAAVSALLSMGVSASSKRSSDNASMLLVAAQSNAPIALFNELLAKASNVNDASRDGMTPLLQAILLEKVDLAAALLKAGANNQPPGARASAVEVGYSRTPEFQNWFRTATKQWSAELIKAAIDSGNLTLTRQLLQPTASEITIDRVRAAASAGHADLVRWMMLGRFFGPVEIGGILTTAAENGNAQVLEALSPYFDRVDLYDLFRAVQLVERRKIPTTLSATLREWQALLFLAGGDDSIVVDGRYSDQWYKWANLSRDYSWTSLVDARDSIKNSGIICNPTTQPVYFVRLDGAQSRGYYQVKPGKCRSFSKNTFVAVTTSGRSLPLTSGVQACLHPNDAFEYSNARDAAECGRRGGRMGPYYSFGDKVGSPLNIR